MSGFVQQIKAMGEEKVGQLAAKLLSNQKFVQGIQLIVSNGLEAKETMDKNMQLVMGAMGMPTAADYRENTDKLEALERDVEEMRDRMARMGDELEALAKASKPKKKKAPAKKKHPKGHKPTEKKS